MSSTSARREALSATVGGLGTFGWMMTGAADILTGDVHDQWNACAGRKGVSPAPWIGRVAFVPCALAVRLRFSALPHPPSTFTPAPAPTSPVGRARTRPRRPPALEAWGSREAL
jgi:hypothetical protein